MKTLTETEKQALLATLKEGPEQSFIAFEFKFGHPSSSIEVSDITSIHGDSVLCHLYMGHKSESEFIKKNDIIAIGDDKNGDVQLHGWGGKFIVLRPEKLKFGESGKYELVR